MINFISKITSNKLGPFQIVNAHCDIPCGIYDPRDAIQAAQTVIRMTELIEEIDFSGGPSHDLANSMARYVTVKEEHAKKAKDDILIIWTDYFKPEHLEKYPDLHDKVRNACKLGSYVKQHVDMDKANEFKSALEEIGEIFWETKK